MINTSLRHLPLAANVLSIRNSVRTALFAFLAACLVPFAHAITPTTSVLAISSTTVPYKSPVILTATVTANGTPVSAGLVLFCDATAVFCENNSALATVQLTANATAVLKLGSGALGVHSYKAVFRANSSYSASASNTVTYTVAGTYSSAVSISGTGTVGDYTLSSGVVGVGSPLIGPTGNISLLDASTGNSVLGTQPLGLTALSQAFVEASGSPFAIATSSTTKRSVALASAYLDSDNNLDVVTGDAEGTITVLLGNGDGTFKPKSNFPGCSSTGRAVKILLADLNRDGKADVILGCSDGANGSLTVLLGNGDGTFQLPADYVAGDVAGVATGDFNGDGILDFVVSNHAQKNVMVFTGVGDGTFAPGSVVLTPSNLLHDVVVADFNGDGKDDAVYAVSTAVQGSALSDLYLALGNGDSTFRTPVLIASEVGEFLTVGDTNKDNAPDVVSTTVIGTPTRIGDFLFVLIGKGDGTFRPKVTYVSDIPSDPHLVDVNGDGIPDIIAGGSFGALVYLGNGDGTFQPYTEPTIGDFALTYAVNAGDLNNDGNADLIGTDAKSPRAAVSLSEVRQSATAAVLSGVAVFPLGSGTHNVAASYVGDSVYLPGISSTIPLLAAPTPTTLALSPSPTSATLPGQSLTLTATLSPYSVGPPDTTTNGQLVRFYNGATLLGSATLNNGVASLATATLPVGTQPIKAVFAGDANYNPSTSSTVNVTVASILLASSLNPSSFQQAVTFTATVSDGQTGNVTFKDGGTTLGSTLIVGTTASLTTTALLAGPHDITGAYTGAQGLATSPILIQQVDKVIPVVAVSTSGPSTFGGSVTVTVTVPVGTTGTVNISSGGLALGSGTVDPSGKVTVTTISLPAGTDTITASYGGDANDTPATGTATQTVAKASPSLPAPVVGSLTPTTIDPITITEHVPSGVSGPVSFFDGTTLLGTAPVVSGVATLNVPSLSLPLGVNNLTAVTPGDANNDPATSPNTVITVSKATPVVTVTTSGPSTYGASVGVTATLPQGTTGTVTFLSGTTILGQGTVSPTGVATIATTSLPTGTDTVTATYSGDPNNNVASGTVDQIVGKTLPNVTVTTSGPSAYGDTVTFTVTVPQGTTGLITLSSGGVTLGTGTVNAAGSVVITTSTLPAGSDAVTATYAGDVNTNAATGSVTQIVTKGTPTSSLASSLNPSTVGLSVTLTDTLPAGVSGIVTFSSGGAILGTSSVSNGVAAITTTTLPAGNVLITATYGGDINQNSSVATLTETVAKATPTLTLSTSGPGTYGSPVAVTVSAPSGVSGTVTITSGEVVIGTGTLSPSGTLTITTTLLPVGTDILNASYGGDSNNNPTSATTTEIIAKATPTVSLTSSANPVAVNQPLTFTATVPVNATGSVTFFDGTTVLGTAAVVSGQATLTTSALTVGSHDVTVSYGGDPGSNAASSLPLSQIVTKATPVLSPPSASSSSVDAVTPVTFTETLPTGVTGPVSFYSGSTLLGTVIVVNGIATLTVPSLPVGIDSITAVTAPDALNNGATSSVATILVTKIDPQLPAPSLTSTTAPAGTPVTISEAVPAGVTGTVSFFNGATLLGTAPVLNGVATLTVSTLPVGSDPISVATPAGAVANQAVSPPAIITITKAVGIITLSSSINPAMLNQSVTFTASTNAAASGVVTFMDGSTTLGIGTIDSSGMATFTTSSLNVGSHPVTAMYGGDQNYTSAASTTLVEVISKTVTAIALSQTTPSQLLNTAVTFTAQVSAAGGSPSGSVVFLDGTTVLGTVPLGTGDAVSITISTASFATSAMNTGSHQITAVYSGDGSFAGSSALPLTNTVSDFTNALKGVGTQNMFPGGSTSYTFTLTPIGAANFLKDVALTISGLPPGTTYDVSPTSIAAGSGVTTVTLHLQTSSALSAQNSNRPETSHGGLTFTLALLGFAGLGAVRKHRRHMPRLLAVFLFSVASLLPIASLSGCAGGYFALTPKSYNISVTGTEGTIQHTATATLIVQ